MVLTLLEKQFKDADADGSGALDRNELADVLKAMYTAGEYDESYIAQ